MIKKIISICVRPMIDKGMGLHKGEILSLLGCHWDLLPGTSKDPRITDVNPYASWLKNK